MTVERWPVRNHRVSDVQALRGSFVRIGKAIEGFENFYDSNFDRFFILVN